jgi:tetratricopeptide (TPR) repeat protein
MQDAHEGADTLDFTHFSLDFMVYRSIQELRDENRDHEALELLELRIADTYRATEISSANFFQAAKLNAGLSTTAGDRYHMRAVSHLRRILRDDPKNEFSWQLLGDLYYREGELKKAGLCYFQVIKHTPNPIIPYAKLCPILRALDRNDLALKAADLMVALNSSDPISLGIKAQANLTAGNIEIARQAVDRIIELTPKAAVAWVRKVQVEVAAKDYTAAKAAANKIIQLDPTNFISWLTLMHVELAAGDIEAAKFSVRRAVERNPLNSPSWGLQAKIDLAAGNHTTARIAIERSLELDPKNFHSWETKAQIESADGDLEAARESFSTSLQLNPLNLKAWRRKLHLELACGDIKAAREVANTVLKLAPDDVVSWGLNIKVALSEGDADTVQRSIDRIRALEPQNPLVALYQGRLALQKGDKETAIQCGSVLMNTFHPTHVFYLRCLVVFGLFEPENYEKIVKALKTGGAIQRNDNGFALSPDAPEDALNHLDRELFTFSEDLANYSRSGIFTSDLIPVPIDGLATDVASNGSRLLWSSVFEERLKPLRRIDDRRTN